MQSNLHSILCRFVFTPIFIFVLVVSGALILTADGGSPQKFVAGESVLVPKGFTGTWEMQGEFRELVVMMRE